MKILQVNVVYKSGSTGKIVYDIHSSLLNRGIESYVAYGRGEKIKENNIYKLAPEFLMKVQSLYSKITGYQYKWCYWSTRRLIKLIDKIKPDIVHLHCINANTTDVYKTLDYLKENNILTVLTHHAEFMYTGGCAHAYECERWKTGCYDCPQSGNKRISFFFDRSKEHWHYLKASYNGFDKLVNTCVSGWLKSRVELSPYFKKNRNEVVLNGLDTKIFTPRTYSELVSRYNLENKKIILHVTPNFSDPFKGGKYIIELAKKFINAQPDFVIIIIGRNISVPPELTNIIPISFTKDQKELAQFYSLANITLLASKRETFSMVTAESLCCGTPVVGFESGGPESIAIPKYSSFVPHGKIEELERVALDWIDFKNRSNSEISLEAKRVYSKDIMVENYLSIYEYMLSVCSNNKDKLI